MPNVRASSGMIGTMRLPTFVVAAQAAQQAGEAHRGRHLLIAGPGSHLGERLVGRGAAIGRRAVVDAFGKRTAERLGAVPSCTGTRSSPPPGGSTAGSSAWICSSGISSWRCRRSRRSSSCCFVIFLIECVALRPSKPSPSVQPLTVLAEDHGRPTRTQVLGRRLVGRVELLVVVAAARQVAQLVVGEVRHHRPQTAGRVRRSARGCSRRSRPRTAGTRRRRCCSSC